MYNITESLDIWRDSMRKRISRVPKLKLDI